MNRIPLCLIIVSVLCALAVLPVYSQPSLRDELSFTSLAADVTMRDIGFKTVYARSGGWGVFPGDYTYKTVEIDNNVCLVDSYRHAQNHAHSNAVLIDWDGDPSNGQTGLKIQPGMQITVQVSVFIQPFAKDWWRDGTGGVVWGIGPGVWKPDMVTDNDSSPTLYDWGLFRGPRIQYCLGDVESTQYQKPVLRSMSPESTLPVSDPVSMGEDGKWYDLRLVVTVNNSKTEAGCAAYFRTTGDVNWTECNRWSFAVNSDSKSADNPANWNAVYLDLVTGIWSRKGYGQPEVSMQDRYDNLSIEIQTAGTTDRSKKTRLFMVDIPEIGAVIQGPKSFYADEDPLWKIRVTNSSDKTLQGKLTILQDSRFTLAKSLDPSFSLESNAYRDYSINFGRAYKPGSSEIQVLLDEKRVIGKQFVDVYAQQRPKPGVNIVRNSSFELTNTFCGTPMRQGDEFFQMFVKDGDKLRWTALPVEGWWADGSTTDGIAISNQPHSGKHSLSMSADQGKSVKVLSALNRMVPEGPVTVSFWMKSQGAKGKIDFDLASSWEQVQNIGSVVRKEIAIPESGDWHKITTTIESPQTLQALIRVTLDAGKLLLDDVQIESSDNSSDFNLRPEEWLRLSFSSDDESLLRQWVYGDKTKRVITLSCDSRQKLSGTARIYMGPWDKPTEKLIASIDISTISEGKTKQISFNTDKLEPNAYVICIEYERDGITILPSYWSLATDQTLGGTVSNGMLRSRSAARFIVAPRIRPGELFGIGNSMLDTNGSWFSGYGLTQYKESRQHHLTGIRTASAEENIYLAASISAPIHSMATRVDFGVPEGAAFANPANPSAIDVFNPDGYRFFVDRAEKIGKEYGASPMIASYQMSNESPYLNGGSLCPSTYADANFREWCKKRFNGNLKSLNKAWKTAYTSWEEVEQISSARFLEEEKNRPKKQGAAAIDWLAQTGTFSAEVEKRMKENPGRTMDWLRWRTHTSVWMYSTFREHARKYDQKTLYGTNLCWPAFWPQMFMPFTRAMDNIQLDIQYTSGLPRALGTPYEMMDSMEMAESSDPTKPVWGIEIYIQPQWPGEYGALQNWGLLAHGMVNNLVFAWKPYSDYGPVIGNKAWEKPDAHPMWMMIDNDGTKLPAYHTYTRSIAEIRSYHQKYNGHSVKRVPAKVAFYVSPDTAEYVVMDTANKPWGSYYQRTRNTLIYLLRMGGITVDYVDDTTMPKSKGKYTKLIVPASPVLSQNAARNIASFARSGGTVVLAGMSGMVDPWLNKYGNVGGVAWADLKWSANSYKTDFAKVQYAKGINIYSGAESATEKEGSLGGKIDVVIDEGKTFRGTRFGNIPGAVAIRDLKSQIVGWTKKWGNGKLVVYGSFPDSYATDPHLSQNMASWLAQMIKLADVPISGRWIDRTRKTTYGSVGTGSAVVEVVVRQKSPKEKFVFCLNQGGSGSGTVEVMVGNGKWQAEDILASKKITGGKLKNGVWRYNVNLKPWGYRVIRLVRK